MNKTATLTAIILTTLLVSTAMLISDSEANTSELLDVNGFKYLVVSEDDLAVELVNSNYPNSNQNSSYSGNVTVPSEVTSGGKTYDVIGLGNRAFFHSQLTSITLAEGLKYIDMSAFADSTLASITIPASVEALGHKTPYGPNVVEGPVFSSSLTSLTFADNSKLSHIGNGALSGTNLSSLEIPAGVTDLGVTYQILGNGISDKVCALDGISDDITITFAVGSPFSWESKALYRGNELYYVFDKMISTISLKDGTDSIGDCALIGCENLISIDLSSVKSIGDCSLAYTDISEVRLPSSITSVGEYTFAYCDSLTSVYVPSSVKSIEKGAFYGCAKIQTITLSEGLETIADSAFCYVSKMKANPSADVLESIVIPSTVESIGDYFLKGALKTDGSSVVVFMGEIAPVIGKESFITSYDKTSKEYSYDFNIWCNADSVKSYENKLEGIGTLNKFNIEVDLTAVSVSENGTKTVVATWNGPEGSSLSAIDEKNIVDVDVNNTGVVLTAEAIGISTLVISLIYDGMILADTEMGVEVKEASNPGYTESTETKTDTMEGQDVTTTITTVTDSSGEVIRESIEITTSTSDDKVQSTATVVNGGATVTVIAGSETPLDNVIEQAELISKIVINDGSLPSSIFKTEIVIENDAAGASVTLTLDIVESLSMEAQDMSVSIIVDHFDEGSMTSAQISALENGKAFELSAVLADNEGAAVDRIHDLGGSVTVFLPFMVSGGMDAEDYGVYYIDIYGNTTDMRSSYDSSRGGFVFETDHFSLFAVMEVPVEDPIIPPFYPGWDDDDIPYIPPTVVDDSDSDEPIKVVACAAAAVAAAIMMMFLIVDSRKR